MLPAIDAPSVEVLLFEVSGQGYGLAAGDVQEVVRAALPVPLPKAPDVVEGVLNLRGKIVPVFDIRRRFGHSVKPLEPDDQFIIARSQQRLVALHVDRTTALVQLDAEQLEAARAVVPGAEYVSWMAKLADGVALIHDLHTFLSRAESAELDAALTALEPEGSAV